MLLVKFMRRLHLYMCKDRHMLVLTTDLDTVCKGEKTQHVTRVSGSRRDGGLEVSVKIE